MVFTSFARVSLDEEEEDEDVESEEVCDVGVFGVKGQKNGKQAMVVWIRVWSRSKTSSWRGPAISASTESVQDFSLLFLKSMLRAAAALGGSPGWTFSPSTTNLSFLSYLALEVPSLPQLH